MKLTRAFAVIALTLPVMVRLSAQTTQEPDWTARGAAWWAHVQFLADDKLQGRLPGTPGFEEATQYVVAQFKAIGLKPAGVNGYLQPVLLDAVRLDAAKSSVTIDAGGKTTPLTVGTDITLSAHVTPGPPVDAPLVFIGYGLRLPSRHMDDFAGMDLKGKVAVFYNGSPTRLQGPLKAYSHTAGQRWKVLKAAGAVGMIAISAPRVVAAPARGLGAATPAGGGSGRAGRGGGNATPRATMVIADPTIDALAGMRLSGTMSPANADKLLTLAGHSMAEMQPLIDAGKALPAFDMKATIHATTAVDQGTPIDTHNIVGELEGSDPKLKKQYIVISAHLDHLGVGRPVNGDAIYNGAMDNASGVASVIEVAKQIAAGPRPKRSILFIALTAEEMGELGSAYFAAHPTVPKADVVADMNMDMYMPLFPLRYLEVQGLGESTLGNDARAVGQLNDIDVQFEKQPDENRFIRSDQVNFVAQGIPAVAFKFGWTPDSPEMKIFNDWVKTRYHQPRTTCSSRWTRKLRRSSTTISRSLRCGWRTRQPSRSGIRRVRSPRSSGDCGSGGETRSKTPGTIRAEFLGPHPPGGFFWPK
jgi:Zn-dependent M28 family amino/carboxypeptidase